MSEWLISIVGVIALGVLLEIVIPEGQTTKYVRGAFSLLVIFVVAAPLPRLLKGEIKFNFSPAELNIDDSFLTDEAIRLSDIASDDIEGYLLISGYTASAKILYEKGSVTKIDRIEIILTLSVLDINEANKHISKVREMIADKTGIEENKIFITAVSEEDEYGSG